MIIVSCLYACTFIAGTSLTMLKTIIFARSTQQFLILCKFTYRFQFLIYELILRLVLVVRIMICLWLGELGCIEISL